MTDLLIRDFTDPRFQAAFQAYFQELEVRVRDWSALFREMNGENDTAWLRLAEDGAVVGFLQFQLMPVSTWFFSARWGFIREFWVSPSYRGAGHGKALLALAEAYFLAEGIHFSLLTTDTAPAFYEKLGYHRSGAFLPPEQEADEIMYLKELK